MVNLGGLPESLVKIVFGVGQATHRTFVLPSKRQSNVLGLASYKKNKIGHFRPLFLLFSSFQYNTVDSK